MDYQQWLRDAVREKAEELRQRKKDAEEAEAAAKSFFDKHVARLLDITAGQLRLLVGNAIQTQDTPAAGKIISILRGVSTADGSFDLSLLCSSAEPNKVRLAATVRTLPEDGLHFSDRMEIDAQHLPADAEQAVSALLTKAVLALISLL